MQGEELEATALLDFVVACSTAAADKVIQCTEAVLCGAGLHINTKKSIVWTAS